MALVIVGFVSDGYAREPRYMGMGLVTDVGLEKTLKNFYGLGEADRVEVRFCGFTIHAITGYRKCQVRIHDQHYAVYARLSPEQVGRLDIVVEDSNGEFAGSCPGFPYTAE